VYCRNSALERMLRGKEGGKGLGHDGRQHGRRTAVKIRANVTSCVIANTICGGLAGKPSKSMAETVLTPPHISHVNFPSSRALALSPLVARLLLTPTSTISLGPPLIHSNLAHRLQTSAEMSTTTGLII
jgi:hypothetical protein